MIDVRAQAWEGPPMGDRAGRWRGGIHPGRIALIVIGFLLWWPIGLVLLAYTLWSGRMFCWNSHDSAHWDHKLARMQEKMDRVRARMGGGGFGGGFGGSSGNRAFDEYKAETLRRLEEEQREFRDFLDRLRHAKDKAEFDQFMAERRRPAPPAQSPDA